MPFTPFSSKRQKQDRKWFSDLRPRCVWKSYDICLRPMPKTWKALYLTQKRIAWCYWSIDFWYGEEIWWQLSYILWSQLACGSFRCCCPSRFSDAAVAIAWWLWLLITDPSYRTKQQWYQHRFSTSLIVDEEHPQKKSIIYRLSEHPDQHKQTSFRRIKESFFAFVDNCDDLAVSLVTPLTKIFIYQKENWI